MSRISRLWRDHRLLLVAFALALAVTLFFAVRTAAFWVYWADPSHHDLAIEGWMTPGYVARSYRVGRAVVGDALGLKLSGDGRVTLAELAAARGVPLDHLEAAMLAAIAKVRELPPND
jgi:hypothetical protein